MLAAMGAQLPELAAADAVRAGGARGSLEQAAGVSVGRAGLGYGSG